MQFFSNPDTCGLVELKQFSGRPSYWRTTNDAYPFQTKMF